MMRTCKATPNMWLKSRTDPLIWSWLKETNNFERQTHQQIPQCSQDSKGRPMWTTSNTSIPPQASEDFASSLCLLLSRGCRLTTGYRINIWEYIVKLHLDPPFVAVSIGIIARDFGTFTYFYMFLKGTWRVQLCTISI